MMKKQSLTMKKKVNKGDVDINKENKLKKKIRMYCTLLSVFLITLPLPVFADDVSDTIDKLADFIWGVSKSIGVILVGYGVIQIGLAFKSHDPSQKSQAVFTILGGLIVFFAETILTLLGVA